ncbi:MAG TPA: DNA polymerase I [bacterium]|nr:DNA polymerase I [bacterium]HPL95575.1 DNA polymerase I [bacterium]
MSQKKFIIIDANSLIHRSFHALPPLTNKAGQLVNAVYGFTVILLKILKELKPDYLACCFDVSRDTFRKQEYEDYKAHRVEQPSELYQQFPFIKQLLAAFKIPVFEKHGFEADDLIGTLSRLSVKDKRDGKNLKNIIVSGDLDALQLVDEHNVVYTLKKGISETIIYDEKAVKERYGFGPEKMVDYKALRGDASDNIPGVKGIGEKTAMELIKNLDSLDEIYETLEKYKDDEKKLKEFGLTKSVREKLLAQKKQAYQSQKLARIVSDMPLKFDLADCQVEAFNTEEVVNILQQLNFTSLINKIPQAERVMWERQGNIFEKSEIRNPKSENKNANLKKGYNLIDDEEKYEKFIKELKKQKEFSLDTETDGLDPFQNKLIGISFAWQKGQAAYIPVETLTATDDLKELKNILGDEKIKKIGHNIKFDAEVLETFGLPLQGIYFDTMVASYLLNPGSRQHNLDSLAFTELGYKTQSIQELTGEKQADKIDLSKIPIPLVANYSCEDAEISWRLYEKLKPRLKENMVDRVFKEIEMPLISILAEMEKNGIKIDVIFLKKMSQELGQKINKLEQKIQKLAHKKFNVASPQQLKEILFDELKIPTRGLSRTKTGISTAAGELDKLKGNHPIIDLILEFREYTKLKNTYLDPLPELADKNNRVHTSFNQTVTATGRLSSTEPNLQNIPIRTELGKKIRHGFIAENGYKILAADYSQIELRIAASVAQDEKMINAFNNKEDIHTQTASEIFGIKKEAVTSEMRRQAKVVNFGILYGLGPRGLAEGTGLAYEEAQEFIEKYFATYKKINDYINRTIAQARAFGYVETIFGRRRYLPEIGAEHQQLRAQAERMAINHPIQGTAADIIKIAMFKVDQAIKKHFDNNEVRMILQIHDELVFEIKKERIAAAKKIIEKEMVDFKEIKVPLAVEIAVGNSWGEC